MKITLENVRTFSGRHDFPLGKLTLLVGENSTGKSSFMAMIAAMFASPGFPFNPSFNDPPYSLGDYDTIATFKGGRSGCAKHFSIGFTQQKKDSPLEVSATYTSDEGRPALKELNVHTRRSHIKLEIVSRQSNHLRGKTTIHHSDKITEGEFRLPKGAGEQPHYAWQSAIVQSFIDEKTDSRELAFEIVDQLFSLGLLSERTLSLAPIRSTPERTYSKSGVDFKPSGDHIPYLLNRIHADRSRRSESRRLVEVLREFGQESGLFEDVNVRRLGEKATDPFQLRIKLPGTRKPRNLIDVGYGVSQALPLVVQSALETNHDMLLMQQPEVHLHPRAQAGLGTLLAKLAAASDRRLIVETHSDYLVDRIRREVAAGVLGPNDMSLLFFSRSGYEVKVFPLRLDHEGNIEDAPPFYREFFIREELALLSRT